jgi:hypothetical protein
MWLVITLPEPFTLRQGVVFCGAVESTSDVVGTNPSTITVAPTSLAANRTNSFIRLQGQNLGVTDLLFHYPNQAKSTASRKGGCVSASTWFTRTIGSINGGSTRRTWAQGPFPSAKSGTLTVTNIIGFNVN